MSRTKLLEWVKLHESLRLKSYQDSEGVWTIGYGRNLQTLEIDEEQAEEWLQEDLDTAAWYARRFPEFEFLDTQARRNVFVEMVFNLGPGGVGKFRNMLAAIRRQDWDAAADEMLDSKWARQVGYRADKLSQLMRRGAY